MQVREFAPDAGRIGSGLPQRVARVLLLGMSDAGALLLAVSAAYVLWALPVREQTAGLYLELAPLTGLFLVGYARAGLYPGFGLGPVETFRRLSYVTLFGFLILASFSFALKLPHLYSRVTFSLTLALGLVLVPVGRALVLRAGRFWSWWPEPVVVVGTGRRAARVIRSVGENPSLGYRVAAILSRDWQPSTTSLEGIPVVGDLDRAPAIAAAGVHVALVETEQALDLDVIDRLQRSFRHVVLLRGYDDLPVEGLQIRNLGNIVGIEYRNNLLQRGNRVAKRLLDISLAAVAMTVSAPIVALAALLVVLVDGRPAFFVHDRLGLDGQRLRVLKIRTMRRDAERRLEEHLESNPDLREEWLSRYKLKDDPRLIPLVGRLLRRFSVDELPQLWLVLTGRMSLVGPRPLPDYHVDSFPQAFRELRARVRPGLTGLWQVSTRGDGDIGDQESYDSYYIRNWSVWLDLYLLARTMAAVATGRGAY